MLCSVVDAELSVVGGAESRGVTPEGSGKEAGQAAGSDQDRATKGRLKRLESQIDRGSSKLGGAVSAAAQGSDLGLSTQSDGLNSWTKRQKLPATTAIHWDRALKRQMHPLLGASHT